MARPGMSSESRKRKRRQQVYGNNATVDYPNIPGVPIDVVPGFVNAIRVATKFFAKFDEVYYGQKQRLNKIDDTEGKDGQEVNQDSDRGNGSTSLVLNSWMDRMEAAKSPGPSAAVRDQHERMERMEDAAGRWLESVKRFVHNKPSATDSSRDSKSYTKQQQPEESCPSRISVPYACFLYTWDLQQTHDRIAVRRACLYLTGLLLQRSKDCRLHLEQEDHLDQWMKNSLMDSKKSKEHLPLLQAEADYWLKSLVQRGYSQLYPKIGVASQRLRQQFAHLDVSTSSDSFDATTRQNLSMADWRRLRDIALEHGDKEIYHLERWIARGYECLDILVPRMGVENPPARAKADDIEVKENGVHPGVEEKQDEQDGGDIEDNDIDWEDGDEDFDDGTSESSNLHIEEHLSAVERTLAAMESSGGLKGGELEIDFRKEKEDENEFTNPNKSKDMEEKREETLAKFRKCVRVLTSRHMPRLTAWVDGLTLADNLTTEGKEVSLVSLPSGTTIRRKTLIAQLRELRQQVSSLLAAASKLEIPTARGVEIGTTGSQSLSNEDTSISLDFSSRSRGGGSEGRQNLLEIMRRQRKRKSRPHRSNRIQIKFRST